MATVRRKVTARCMLIGGEREERETNSQFFNDLRRVAGMKPSKIPLEFEVSYDEEKQILIVSTPHIQFEILQPPGPYDSMQEVPKDIIHLVLFMVQADMCTHSSPHESFERIYNQVNCGKFSAPLWKPIIHGILTNCDLLNPRDYLPDEENPNEKRTIGGAERDLTKIAEYKYKNQFKGISAISGDWGVATFLKKLCNAKIVNENNVHNINTEYEHERVRLELQRLELQRLERERLERERLERVRLERERQERELQERKQQEPKPRGPETWEFVPPEISQHELDQHEERVKELGSFSNCCDGFCNCFWFIVNCLCEIISWCCKRKLSVVLIVTCITLVSLHSLTIADYLVWNYKWAIVCMQITLTVLYVLFIIAFANPRRSPDNGISQISVGYSPLENSSPSD